MGQEGRDGTEGTGHTGGQCSHPQSVVPGPRGPVPSTHGTHTPHGGARAGAGALVGLGGTGDVVGTPGWGHGPSVGHCAFQWRWLSRDPHPRDPRPRDPRPSWSWVPLSPAPVWVLPPVPGGCVAPHAPCTHPRSHTRTRSHTCRHVHGASILGRRAGDRGPRASPAGDTPLCPRSAGGGPRRPCSSSSLSTPPQVSGAGTGAGRGWDMGQGWTWWQGTSGLGGSGRDGTGCHR